MIRHTIEKRVRACTKHTLVHNYKQYPIMVSSKSVPFHFNVNELGVYSFIKQGFFSSLKHLANILTAAICPLFPGVRCFICGTPDGVLGHRRPLWGLPGRLHLGPPDPGQQVESGRPGQVSGVRLLAFVVLGNLQEPNHFKKRDRKIFISGFGR